MKQIIGLALLLSISVAAAGWGETLTREQQQQIIQEYMYVTGQSPTRPAALDEYDDGLPDPGIIKCGMSAVANFVLNRDKLDKDLVESMGLALEVRPVLPNFYDSPSGRFKIHYAVAGDDAVYRPSEDLNGNSIPDYVDGVARIMDSVYVHIIDILGYPAPPSDDFYPSGGDSRYDVYLLNLGPGVYGLSYIDSTQIDGEGTLRATSFMELDATYNNLPQYSGNPLEAVRVTAAHEFFHTVQFGIDFTEAPLYSNNTLVGRYWMEMSAVWMEEELYPDINDYYNYMPWFFNDPRASLQQFNTYSDIRPYAAGIYPMFLVDVFGRDIIREIWLRCGEYGVGDDFLLAAQVVIDSLSDGAASWATVTRDFTLRNWFTGKRADQGPDLYSWSQEQRDTFPAFPDSMISIRQDYPVIQLANENRLNPLHNGAAYILLNDLDLITYDTGYYVCNVYYDSACADSQEVFDPLGGYDFLRVDVASGDTTYWDCMTWADTVCGDSLQVASTDPWEFIHVRRRTPTSRPDTTYWRCTGYVDFRCIDSTEVPDSLSGHDFVYIDSVLDLTFLLGTGGLRLVEPWGVSFVFRLAENPDSIEIVRGTLPDSAVSYLGFPNPHQYRSVAIALSPATYSSSQSYYRSFPYGIEMDVGYLIEGEIDNSAFVNLPTAILTPYPNPAVVSRMGSDPVTFRMQVPTDSTAAQLYTGFMLVDIFTVAGERVRTIQGPVDEGDHGLFEITWDMKNEAGKNVASGAYIAYARLYDSDRKSLLLAEDHVKVAVIR